MTPNDDKKSVSPDPASMGDAERLRQQRARRKERIVVTLVVLGVSLFLGWLYCYLRPDTWHYYTDESTFRHLAKDVDPRFVLWEESRVLPGTFNTASESSAPVVSPDGAHMVFTRGLAESNANLYVSKWDGRAWGEPGPMRALNSRFNELDPSFSKDGKYLFFATDRPGGPGGFDIWVSRWDGAEYAWPVPLSIMVNSKFDDRGPEPSGAGDKLYFSSKRPRGQLTDEEEDLSNGRLREHFKDVDYDLFAANRIPSGITNRAVERAQSMLYFLRESALADPKVMGRLGGSDKSERAVDKAIEWLATNQETNGNWSIAKHGGRAGHDVGATAFALLTFFGRGERHDKECHYQGTVSNGVKWLVGQQNRLTGDLRGPRPPSQGMYDHSIASLALAEAYGLTKDENLYEPAQSAIDFLVDSQNVTDGGWRYTPGQEGDLSVAGWAIMALKSAYLSGLHVPESTFEGIRKWLHAVAKGQEGGMYQYQPGRGLGSPAMVATGYFCSQLMGLSPNTPKSFETAGHLRKVGLRTGDIYYMYYGTLCSYQNQGPLWREWMGKMHKSLLKEQYSDGSWMLTAGHGKSMGRAIVTSLVALSLQAHYRYTPLYGLGYEPDPKSKKVSAANEEDLEDVPEYRRAKRLKALSSPKEDIQPCVSGHGDFLYFASDRHGGLGGYDLYRSRISGDDPTPPINLGTAVNSAGDDIDPATRAAGFELIFGSDRDRENDRFVLRSAVSRIVFRHFNYDELPALGWMLEKFKWRLAFLLIALVGFVYFVVKGRLRRRAAGTEATAAGT